MATQYGAVNIITKYGQPSLDLQFSGPKGSLKDRMGDVEVEFTRSSVGTYVGSDGLIKTAVDDEARFDHDPVTGENLGLLIEESRTNLVQYSEDFQNQWSVGGGGSGGSATNSQTVSPDGNNTGAKFAAPATRYLTETTTETGMPNTGVRFNLAAGTFDSVITGSPDSYDIDPAGNGWYRCWFTVSNLTFSVYAKKGELDFIGIQILNSNVYLYALNSTSNQTSTTDGIYVWGGQLEANAGFPTSYIPTSGSTVTRAADVASITGTNFSSWFNGNQGTMVSDVIVPSTDCSYYAFTGANHITALALSSPGTLTQSIGSQLSFAGTSYDDPVKFAVAYDDLEFVAVRDGGTVQSDPSTVNKTGIDKLYLGRYYSGTNFAKGVTISRLAYYPRRLTDEQLQELTQ